MPVMRNFVLSLFFVMFRLPACNYDSDSSFKCLFEFQSSDESHGNLAISHEFYEDLYANAFIEEDELKTTDFFNYCHPFIKYCNGDEGILEEGMCSCGIYGKYFKEFYGRRVDAVMIENKLVSGHRISAALQIVLRELRINLSYKIIQNTLEEIEFYYCGEISDNALQKIAQCLASLLKCKVVIYQDNNLLNMKSKNCLVKSQFVGKNSL